MANTAWHQLRSRTSHHHRQRAISRHCSNKVMLYLHRCWRCMVSNRISFQAMEHLGKLLPRTSHHQATTHQHMSKACNIRQCRMVRQRWPRRLVTMHRQMARRRCLRQMVTIRRMVRRQWRRQMQSHHHKATICTLRHRRLHHQLKLHRQRGHTHLYHLPEMPTGTRTRMRQRTATRPGAGGRDNALT